jgi:hypothetical protein
MKIVTTTCNECGATQSAALPADACANCGERIGSTCFDCSNCFFVEDLDANRRCEECAESAGRVAKRQQALDDYEAHGDYLRDEQKGWA